MTSIKLLALALLSVALMGTGGCKEDGPAERAGERVDEAVDDVRDAGEDAADEVRDAADEIGDEIDQRS